MELKCNDEIIDIVEAANTAGWLEAEGKIVIESDEDLAEFLIDHRNRWAQNQEGKCFADYIVEKLLEKYEEN